MENLRNAPVAIARCGSYDPPLLDESIERAWRLSGSIDVKGKRVLLKPNILRDAPPEKAITTHPEFLKSVIRLMKKEGAASVHVGDSPAFQKPGFSGRASGLKKAAESEGAVWVNFTHDTFTLPAPDGKKLKEFRVTSAIKDADVIISSQSLNPPAHALYRRGKPLRPYTQPWQSPYHVLYPEKRSCRCVC